MFFNILIHNSNRIINRNVYIRNYIIYLHSFFLC